MRLVIGSDHAGFELKEEIKSYIEKKGHEVKDVGTYSCDSVDYPTYGKAAAAAVVSGACDLGILICGSGIGIGISANKVEGVRCAIVSEPVSARLAREHNDANMVAFGSRIVGIEMAKAIVDHFLGSTFEGGRHQRRIDAIEERK